MLSTRRFLRCPAQLGRKIAEGWVVTVETPKYRALEKEGVMEVTCKTKNQQFRDLKQFVRYTQTIAEATKSQEDLVFEEAAKQLVEEEVVQTPPKTEKTSTLSSEKVEKKLKIQDIELKLLISSNGDESVMLNIGGESAKGVTEIRRLLFSLAVSGDAERKKFVNSIKTYLPATLRQDYTLASAFAIIERKVTASPVVSNLVQAQTQTAVIPDVPSASAYTQGSADEREQLLQVSSEYLSDELPVQIPSVTRRHGPLTFNLDECSVMGTAENPSISTPEGEMSLTEFVAMTSAESYDIFFF